MVYKNFRSTEREENRLLIDMVCDHFAFPDSTFLGTRITKKMIFDSSSTQENELNRSDKKLVTDVIQSIEWQNTLKPETINIPVYVTETVEYIEIAVIRVTLKSGLDANSSKQKSKLKDITKLLHSLIPYPVILLVEFEGELSISLADKRINLADSSKLVIEEVYNSGWLNTKNMTENECRFLNDFSLKNVSMINYFELYQDLISMLICLKISKMSGQYFLKKESENQKYNESISEASDERSDIISRSSFIEKSNKDKTALLQEFERLEAELSSIRNKIKKETQMNNKMCLNIEAKNVKQAISTIKNQLN